MASNPAIVVCTKNTWVKVATNVTTAVIWKRSLTPSKYFQTYRLTGAAAPTDLSTAISWLEQSLTMTNSAAIDIYIYASDSAGEVRVDA
jgi:hypothetical protein